MGPKKKTDESLEYDFDEKSYIRSYLNKRFEMTKAAFFSKTFEVTKNFIGHAYYILITNEKSKSKTRPLEALKYFHYALLCASAETAIVSLVYAHRAEFYLMDKKYDLCLLDCESALKSPFAMDNTKLACYYYKARCYEILKRYQSKEENDSILKAINSYNMVESLKLTFYRKIKKIYEILPTFEVREEEPVKQEAPNKSYLNFERQELNRCASKSIEVVVDKKGNKHVVACKDIEPGEIIVVENHFPGSIKLFENDAGYYCCYCQKKSWRLTPCEVCINSLYCSDDCMYDDMEQYHEWECQNLPQNLPHKYRVSWRFFSVLVRKCGGLDNYNKHFAKDTTWLKLGNLRRDNKLSSNLTLNHTYADLDFQFACETAYMWATTTDYLKKSRENIKTQKVMKNEKVIAFAAAVLRSVYLYAANCCAFHVYAPKSVNANKYVAVYPFARHFNHSCHPNAAYFTSKDQEIVIFAKYPIAKGTEITISYINSTYVDLNKETRISILNNIKLSDCLCDACKQNWSTTSVKSLEFLLRKKPTVLKDLLPKVKELMSEIKVRMDVVKDDKKGLQLTMIPKIVEALKLIHEESHSRCEEYNEYFTILTTIYIVYFGNIEFNETSLDSYNPEDRVISWGWYQNRG